MTIEIDLVLARREAVACEAFVFTIPVANIGGSRASVRHPALDAYEPRIEVRDAEGAVVWVGGRVNLAQRRSHQYSGPRLLETTKLDPGQAEICEGSWADWVPALPPGEYRVRALFTHEERELASPERLLTIEALSPRASAFVGPDAGVSSVRYALVVHQSSIGSCAIFTALHDIDREGHFSYPTVRRLADVPADAHIVASVTQRGLPFPGQWIVWIERGRLRGLYHMQGTVELTFDRPLPYPAQIAGPVLVDLEGNDGTTVPRAELVLVTPGLAELFELDANAPLVPVRSWTLGPGELEWASATFPAHGGRHVLLAIKDGDTLRFDHFGWTTSATRDVETIARQKGRVLGGAMSVATDDVVWASLVVRREREQPPADYHLVQVAIEKTASSAQVAIITEPPLDFVRAFVDCHGQRALAVLHAVGDRWLAANERGIAHPFDKPSPAAEPLAAYLLAPERPAVLWDDLEAIPLAVAEHRPVEHR